MSEEYKAQGECTNCGYENWPQWGYYEVGKALSEYPCPKCKCMTWIPRRADGVETNANVETKPNTGTDESSS